MQSVPASCNIASIFHSSEPFLGRPNIVKRKGYILSFDDLFGHAVLPKFFLYKYGL